MRPGGEMEALDEALSQMRAHGLVVEAGEFAPDGLKHLCAAEGHRSGAAKRKKGWYVAHLITLDDGVTQVVVGAFGNSYTDGDQAHKFRVRAHVSDADRQRLKERTEQLLKEFEANRKELAEVAAKRAQNMWPRLPQVGGSPYLDRKQVRAYGLRFARGAIVIPVVTMAGTLVGLQFIGAEGDKKFLKGTPKQGAFHLLGGPSPDHPLVFAEGYATAASVHMATRWPVVVCFDAGNLWHCVKAWREAQPDLPFVIAADNDHETRGNPGLSKARRAALDFGAKLAHPEFREPAGRTDFNDLHVEQGLPAVAVAMQSARMPEPDAPAEPPEMPPDMIPPDDPPAGASSGGGGRGGRPEWMQQLTYGEGGLKAIVHNLRLIMQHHEALGGLFGYDQFQQRIVMRRDPPWRGVAGTVQDVDEIECAAWFGRRDTFRLGVTTNMAREAIAAVAREYVFHPVRDYLSGCAQRWDGVDRIPTFFPDFCGVARNAVHEAFARNFFISAVARIFRPGVKADLMLVLEGTQGLRKSTLFNMLAGDDWFLDLGAMPTDKDFYQLIQGRWLVEISELASFAKADTSHIKRAITTRHDVFRPAYGRNPIEAPRQCVFVGTVNNSSWQRDETGARRYMPILVTEINFEAIRDLRDQLWGEAVVRFWRDESWWELPSEAVEVQADRYEDDVWAQPIIRWLDGKAPAEQYASGTPAQITCTTTAEILGRALWVETKKQDRSAQSRVGTVMTRLGWPKRQRRHGGVRVWQYTRPVSSGDVQ